MLREWDMSEVSDGRVYHANDMVKVGCADCEGCSECCRTSQDTIVLDPFDIAQLTVNLNKSFEELLNEGYVELGNENGMIFVNLNLKPVNPGEQNGCHFLDSNGRCSIHGFRPGICRLFPLGRIYEEDTFSYFLQVHECIHPGNRSKVKISKWIGIGNIREYERFIVRWHGLVKKIQLQISESKDLSEVKALNMKLLNSFYMVKYANGNENEIFEQVNLRIDEFCK